MAAFRLRVMIEGRIDLINIDADFLIDHVFFADPSMGRLYAAKPLIVEIQQDGQTVARHEYQPRIVEDDPETEEHF